MAIKKRKPVKKHQLRGDTYVQMREHQWANQPDPELVDWRGSKMRDGSDLPHAILQPRKNLFMKDIWMCPDKETAFRVGRSILSVADANLTDLQVSGRWVWVKFGHADDLPGQEPDDRKRVTG